MLLRLAYPSKERCTAILIYLGVTYVPDITCVMSVRLATRRLLQDFFNDGVAVKMGNPKSVGTHEDGVVLDGCCLLVQSAAGIDSHPSI